MRFFPGVDSRNIAVAYVAFGATKCWFTAATWLFFYRDTVTNTEVGTIFVVSVAVMIGFEVPSGVLSDRVGHRKVLIVAGFLFGAGNIVIAFNTGFYSLLCGIVMQFIGMAFYSGALDAFTYESLREVGKENLYERVAGSQASLTVAVKAIATLLGSLLFLWQRNAPNIAIAVFHALTVVCLLLFAHEPELPAKQIEPDGEAVKTSWMHTLVETIRNPVWWPIIVLAVAASGLAANLGWGPFELSIAEVSGFTPATLYLFLVPAFIYETITVGFFSQVSTRIAPVHGFFIAAVISGMAYLVMGFGTMVAFIAGVLLVRPAQQYLHLFMLSYVQKRVDTKVRASALSVVSLLRWAIIAPVVYASGAAADNTWVLQLSFCISAAILASVLLQAFINTRKSQHKNLHP